MPFLLKIIILISLIIPINSVKAADIHVAVASNFTLAARDITAAFEKETGIKVLLSFGSTGKIYAQIIHGAPYDAFLAADAERPEKLEAENRIVAGSRMTYATGALVLWSPDENLINGKISNVFTKDFRRFAIASPKTAPYGVAAVEVLKSKGLYDIAKPKLVMGNNIIQTLQFVASGNAEMAFIAASQATGLDYGSRWAVPTDLHSPLTQQAVVLKTSKNKEAAQKFLDFLNGPQALAIKSKYQYGSVMSK